MPRAILPAVLALLLGTAVWPQVPGQVPGLLTRQSGDRAITLDAVDPAASSSTPPLSLQVDRQPVPAGLLRQLPPERASLLLVLDALNCSPQEFLRTVQTVSAFLASGGAPLPQRTTILILSGGASHTRRPGAVDPGKQRTLSFQRIPASTDGLALRSALQTAVQGVAQSPETIADRVGLSLDALAALANAEAAEPGAKLVLWLSPGWPLLPPGTRESAEARQQVFDSAMELSGLLLRARILLYMLNPTGISTGSTGFNEGFLLAARPDVIASLGHAPALPDTAGDELYLDSVRSPSVPAEARENDLALQVLAIQSGGLVVQHENMLDGALARCAADTGRIRSVQYLPPAASGPLRFFPVRVMAAGQAAPLRSRQGYYAR